MCKRLSTVIIQYANINLTHLSKRARRYLCVNVCVFCVRLVLPLLFRRAIIAQPFGVVALVPNFRVRVTGLRPAFGVLPESVHSEHPSTECPHRYRHTQMTPPCTLCVVLIVCADYSLSLSGRFALASPCCLHSHRINLSHCKHSLGDATYSIKNR